MCGVSTVVVAQLVEPQIVVLVVAGSSPVDHPIFLIMKHIFYLPIILFLFGCVVIPSKRVTFNDIKVGMPREEAVSLLGKPHRISAKGNEEKLYYNESALYIGIFGVGKVKEANREYRLHLIDGKVDSFGLVGEHGAEVEAEKGDEE